MAVTMSLMLQKGGVGKSTLTGILAYLLRKRGYRTLVVDMDSQGNVTELVSQRDVYSFAYETVLEAVEDQDPRLYIVECENGVHLLPADDLLAIYGRRIRELRGEIPGPEILYLKRTLDVVSDDYDYILIDCPPSLNEQTTSALSASDVVITVMQTEVHAFRALSRFFETVFHIKRNVNPGLRMIGISAGMMDRYALNTTILDEVRNIYGDLVFNTVLRRYARVAEFATLGISDARTEQKQALVQYDELLDEILQRIESGYEDKSIYLKALEERLYYAEDKLYQELPAVKRERFAELYQALLNQIEVAKEWLG